MEDGTEIALWLGSELEPESELKLESDLGFILGVRCSSDVGSGAGAFTKNCRGISRTCSCCPTATKSNLFFRINQKWVGLDMIRIKHG